MKAIIDASFEKEVQDLQSLIRIPSVSRGEPEENMPYGRNVEQALVQMKQIARDLGFENVWDVEHRCGVIEYGQGEEVLAIAGGETATRRGGYADRSRSRRYRPGG